MSLTVRSVYIVCYFNNRVTCRYHSCTVQLRDSHINDSILTEVMTNTMVTMILQKEFLLIGQGVRSENDRFHRSRKNQRWSQK